MVSISQLEKQIAREKAKREDLRQVALKKEKKRRLELELKNLRKSPSRIRNEKLANKTISALKTAGKKTGKALVRQGKRIQKQQLRDAAATKKKGKKIKSKANPFPDFGF